MTRSEPPFLYRLSLAALRRKYVSLCRLRKSRERLEKDGVFLLAGNARILRHGAVRVLAQDFPGCLRELDELTAVALAARLRAVDVEIALAAAEPGRERPRQQWIGCVLDFHDLLRAARCVRGWLVAQRRDGRERDDLELALGVWYRRRGQRTIDLPMLRRLFERPQRRLMPWVWIILGERYQCSALQVKRIILGQECQGGEG